MISHKQHGLLRVAKADLGLDEAAWRDLLAKEGGVTSARDLSPAGFRRVVDCLKRAGFKPTSARKTFGVRHGFASDDQIAMIVALWRVYTGADTDAGLNAWLESRFKVSSVRFLTTPNAAKVIQAVKAMSARKSAKSKGARQKSVA